MAGHSKWANIKHRKAGQDAKRGKVFTKLIREITVAAREGGGNINDNPSLRRVVEKANGAQMPKDTIDRAILRGAGGQEGADLVRLTYEGYGPGGVAILVETMTDNKNRTVAEVRHAFTKAGGNLGTDGSVAYLFEKRGLICLPPGTNEERAMEIALDSGAEDIDSLDDGALEVVTDAEAYQGVRDAFADAGFAFSSAELTMLPSTYIPLDVDTGEKVLGLIERLEDLDDVQNVYSNADLPDELMQE